jgi:hypothetical protein
MSVRDKGGMSGKGGKRAGSVLASIHKEIGKSDNIEDGLSAK